MNKKEIEAQINEFKNKVVDNVDSHFIEELSDDILDVYDEDENDNYYLIEDTNRYVYWILLAIDFNKFMQGLVTKKHNIKEFDKYFAQCVYLKNIIDENLISYKLKTKAFNDSIYEEINKDIKNEIYIQSAYCVPEIQLRGNEKEQKKIINNLYEFLKDKWKIIDANYKEFAIHFSPVCKNTDRIKWTGRQESLLAFIKLLKEKSIISNSTLHTDREVCTLISNHFLSKHGKQLNFDSIVNTYSNPTFKPHTNEKKEADLFVESILR